MYFIWDIFVSILRVLLGIEVNEEEKKHTLLEYPDSPEAKRIHERRTREENLAKHHPPPGL